MKQAKKYLCLITSLTVHDDLLTCEIDLTLKVLLNAY